VPSEPWAMNSDWGEAPIGELLSALIDHRGRTPKKLGGDFVQDGVRVISAKNVRGGRLDLSFEPRFVSKEMFERWMPNKLQTGDVLLTSEAPMGEVAFLNGDCRYCLGQRLFALRANQSRLDKRFLYFALRSPLMRARLYARISGTTAQGIKQSQLVQVRVPVPPLDEQRRISNILGALDDKIEHNRSLSQRLLLGAALIVDHALESCDATASVYEFAAVTYGAAFKSAQFGDGGVPVLRIRDLATHLPGMKTTEEHPKARLVRRGDVVVGMDGEFRAHLWHGPDSLLNQRVCVFDPVAGVSRAFVWRAIRSPLAFVEATESGTTVIHLGKADIDEFELPAPTPEQMRNLVEHADPLVALSVLLGRQSQRLGEVRDALLPKLVSGTIRVPASRDPDDARGTVAETAGVAVP
jgi:type I restriction enzyme S subunit